MIVDQVTRRWRFTVRPDHGERWGELAKFGRTYRPDAVVLEFRVTEDGPGAVTLSTDHIEVSGHAIRKDGSHSKVRVSHNHYFTQMDQWAGWIKMIHGEALQRVRTEQARMGIPLPEES